MTIKILNQESELSSFPIKQSIFLYSDDLLEETNLKDNIILFRLQSENQLVSLAPPYSYTLGYIKETFDIIEMSYKIESYDSGYKITCDPTTSLSLDSKYCIFVSKDLSEKFITVDKTISKSNSTIEVVSTTDTTITNQFEVEVLTTSSLINGKNLVNFKINGVDCLLDLRESKVVTQDSYKVLFKDVIYVTGEKFTVTIANRTNLVSDFQYVFNTVNSGSITPLENQAASTVISNQQILDYYQQLNSNVVVSQTVIVPTYLGPNVFSIPLPEGFELNLVETIINDVRVAYNNYILESLNLYNKDDKFILHVYKDDFDGLLIFELVYSLDELQTEKLIIDTSSL